MRNTEKADESGGACTGSQATNRAERVAPLFYCKKKVSVSYFKLVSCRTTTSRSWVHLRASSFKFTTGKAQERWSEPLIRAADSDPQSVVPTHYTGCSIYHAKLCSTIRTGGPPLVEAPQICRAKKCRGSTLHSSIGRSRSFKLA